MTDFAPDSPGTSDISIEDQLLSTKVTVPRIRPNLLPRPHLVHRVDEALTHDLTLVCTPAGYGKTTLLAEWAARSSRPVAWLSLDNDDNDPVRFWRYVIAALERVYAGVGESALALLGATERLPGGAAVTALINCLTVRDAEVVLVLDDYHLIRSPAVHEGLAFLLDHLPPRLHLVLAGRSDPPLPLAGLRGRGRLAELRAADLRFTPAEVDDLLDSLWGLHVSAEVSAALAERTEGWVAGLQLAALSLRHQPDPSAFVAAFSGSHRFVLDYLSEEVLAHQSEDVRAFLLATSVLGRLCGPLCDAVTSRTDGQAMLETLERANLFVVPLDERRHWYRYHQLFADLLRARLGQRFPDAAAGLHRRAAAWYEQHGRLGDTVHHAQEAGDHELAARLIERVMEELIWWRSEGATLARWLAALPQDVLGARPRLSLGRAIQALVAGRLEEAATLAMVAERSCSTMDDDCYAPTVERTASELVNVPAAIGFVHAAVAVQRGQAERANQFAVQAIAHLAEEDRQLRAVVEVVAAEAAWLTGDLTQAEKALDRFIVSQQTERQPQRATHALFDLGQVQVARGQLRAATQTYRRGLALLAPPDRSPHPSAVLQHLGLAEVLRQQGDLAAARHHAIEGVELSRMFYSTQAMATGMATLAWIQFAVNDHETARSTIAEAAEAVANSEVVALFNPVPSEQIRLRLALGEFGDALHWVAERGLCDEDDLPYAREREYLVYARVLIACGNPARALRLLHRLEVAATAAERQGSLVEVAVLQALALDAAGKPAGATDAIAQALARAQAEGYVRVFADEGAPMGALLRTFLASARRGNVPAEDRALVDYAGRLLDAVLTAPNAVGSIAAYTAAPSPGLVEPLTERECEVLMLLTAGKSNREIADALVVTLDTVKKHLTHIFGKLGATSRTQAVARARELGFLA